MTEHKDQETATADSQRERDGLPGGEAGPGSGGEDQQDVAGAGGSPDPGDPGGMGGVAPTPATRTSVRPAA